MEEFEGTPDAPETADRLTDACENTDESIRDGMDTLGDKGDADRSGIETPAGRSIGRTDALGQQNSRDAELEQRQRDASREADDARDRSAEAISDKHDALERADQHDRRAEEFGDSACDHKDKGNEELVQADEASQSQIDHGLETIGDAGEALLKQQTGQDLGIEDYERLGRDMVNLGQDTLDQAHHTAVASGEYVQYGVDSARGWYEEFEADGARDDAAEADQRLREAMDDEANAIERAEEAQRMQDNLHGRSLGG